MNSIQDNAIKNDFDEVMNRLKSMFNISTNVELADKLNLSQTAYSERVRRKSIPYEKVFELCLMSGIDVNYIFGVENNFPKNKSMKQISENIKKYKNYNLFGDDTQAEPFNFANEFCDNPDAKFSAVIADNIHMFPIIDVGDIVIVNENDKEFNEDGKLFLVKYKSNIAVVRILKTIEPDEVVMEFENPLLENIKTKLKNLTVLGKVISVHRSMV